MAPLETVLSTSEDENVPMRSGSGKKKGPYLSHDEAQAAAEATIAATLSTLIKSDELPNRVPRLARNQSIGSAGTVQYSMGQT